MDYTAIPTVLPFAGFNPSEDAATLRSAMKGFGTDEDQIIDVLAKRTNAQRQQIKKAFEHEFARDLIDDLKSELGGKFEDVIVGLMSTPDEFLCKELNKAMDGIGTNESTLVEILCTRSNEEVKHLAAVYEDLFTRPLAEHMCSETNGHFRRLLTLVICGVRDPAGKVDPDRAKEEAAQLYNAGEGKLGTDEEVFNKILSRDNFAQLRLVFEEYKNLSGETIEQALEHEMDGDLLEAMMAIVECVQSPAAFFANRIHKAMDGAGTDDPTLIRVIVSRSEIDLETIKQEYERIYNRTLLSALRNETTGDYHKVLCALIGEA